MNDSGSSARADSPSRRRQGRLPLVASMVLTFVAIVIVVGAVVASVTGDADPLPGSEHRQTVAGASDEARAGLCLAAVAGAAEAAGLSAAIEAASAKLPLMLPAPLVDLQTGADAADGPTTIVTVWPSGMSEARLEKWRAAGAAEDCPARSDGWTVRVSHTMLANGADSSLEAATFSDEWTAAMDVVFDPLTSAVRTTLHFSGPLKISGSCWVDDILGIDPANGSVVVTSVAGDDAGLPGLVACRKFSESLPDGAAGEQAISLVPAVATDASGQGIRLVAESIELTDDAIVIEGSFATDVSDQASGVAGASGQAT